MNKKPACTDRQKLNYGFTLIELLTVVAILGFIASVIMTNVRGSTDKAKIANGLRFSDTIVRSLADNMVSYWSFNEGGGTETRDGWSNNNGTINGGGAWVVGMIGNALSFDGVNDYMNVSSPSDLYPNIFTVEAWVKLGDTDINPLIGWSNTSYPSLNIHFSANRALIYLGSSNYRYFNHSPVDIDDGKWHHVVFVVTGNNQNDILNSKMYADGIQQIAGNTTNSGLPAVKNLFYLGRRAGNYFNGFIDEVKIYNTILTAREIQEHYAESAPRYGIVIK